MEECVSFLNGEINIAGLEPTLSVPLGGSVTELAKNRLGRFGFCFVYVNENINGQGDIPRSFDYASGFIVHRSDTLSIVLFGRHLGDIAINSWNSREWGGWKILSGDTNTLLSNIIAE